METPIPKTSVTSFSLKNCSAKSGHVTTGTPPQIPSSVEFQPQWVTKPPIAAWSRITTWGAHPLIISPRFFTRSSNPSGIHSSITLPSLTTQTKSRPEFSSPIAISRS
ncbi:hypothetical protein ABFX02_14G110200 [Erythranthe guttata]